MGIKNKKEKSVDTKHIGGKIFFRLEIEKGCRKNVVSRWPFMIQKKLHDPLLPKFTEAETPQVTTAKLPHGTRKHPLSAATFLS